jgi:hypothetical protein
MSLAAESVQAHAESIPVVGQYYFHSHQIFEDVLDLFVGQVSCTTTVAMRVRKKPASCG